MYLTTIYVPHISPYLFIIMCSTVKSSQFWIIDTVMVGAVNLAESSTSWEMDFGTVLGKGSHLDSLV